MTKKVQKKQLIHCEEMQDYAGWIKKKRPPTDCIGWYFPTFSRLTHNRFLNKVLLWIFPVKWEVIMAEGGYTADSQFEAEVVSSLEQIKILLLRRKA